MSRVSSTTIVSLIASSPCLWLGFGGLLQIWGRPSSPRWSTKKDCVLESGVGRDSNGEDRHSVETDGRGNDRSGRGPDDQPLLAIEALGRAVGEVVIDP